MKIKNLVLLIVFIGLSLNTTLAQTLASYTKYPLNTFLQEKTWMITMDSIADQIKYPTIYRENGVEGYCTFMIKSDGDNHFELIQYNATFHSARENHKNVNSMITNLFHRAVEKALHEIGLETLVDNNEKCFTEFTVKFDLKPYDQDDENCDIIVRAEIPKLIIKRSH